MFFRISQYTPKQTEDECGNEDRGVYSLFFWNSEDKYKSWLPLNLEPTNGHNKKEYLVSQKNNTQFNVLSWYLKRKIFRNHYKIKHCVK